MSRRPVRYVDPEALAAEIALALPDHDVAARFVDVDLAAAINSLSVVGAVEALEEGPTWIGGRMIVEPGQTVGAFNLFAAVADDGAVVVIGVDIWPHGFPDDL